MTRKLTFGQRAAKSGQTKSLVIFLHGYGSDSADLLSLADVLAPHLPNTAFAAPDAPDRVPGAPFGYQWFSIPRFDGTTEVASQAGLAAAAQDLAAFIREQAESVKIDLQAIALVGFSQGAMMAMHVAPRLDHPLTAVVAISGRLVVPDRLAAEAKQRPPILLIHGDQDDVVPFESLQFAGDRLNQAGFEVFAHVMQGTGHGIAPDGLQAALGFLHKFLPK